MLFFLQAMQILGDIDKRDPSIPALEGDFSAAMPFIIAGLIVGAIMMVGFRQAKRNHLDKAD